MRLVKQTALMSWTTLKEYREMNPLEYIEWDNSGPVPCPGILIFISHRWITPTSPVPTGEQLREIQSRVDMLPSQEMSRADSVVFYDYCSMLQRPRTAHEDAIFYRDIDSLTTLLRSADMVIILSEGYTDYKNRAWCFFEAIASESRVRFFDDQAHIRRDLEFLDALMCNDIPQGTSYDFSYKADTIETEILIAALQHLSACKVTHPEDLPRIKSQMIRFFNDRRLTSFGKLVTAICKYFDVVFAVLPARGGGEAIPCRPFFEEPEWDRLPAIECPTLMNGHPGGSSLFALPAIQAREISRQLDGFVPILRLALHGVKNQKLFLDTFQNDPNSQNYVVDPIMLGERGDCFPSLAHVIHTALERPPGFFYSRDRQYLFFTLSGE